MKLCIGLISVKSRTESEDSKPFYLANSKCKKGVGDVRGSELRWEKDNPEGQLAQRQ